MSVLKGIPSRIVRGIRDSIPSGHFIGRASKGDGPAELIPLSSVAQALNASGLVGGGIPPLTDGHIFVGNSSNVATDVAMSGDVHITDTGATTIQPQAVTLAKIANATASSKLLGSGVSGAGASYSEISLGVGLSISGTTLSANNTTQADGWTSLTFSTQLASAFGFSPWESDQTFPLAAGQRIEIEGEIYRTTSAGTSGTIIASADGTNAYYLDSQTDGNVVVYKRVSSTSTALGSSGATATNNFLGVHPMRFDINVVSTASNIIVAVVNFFRLPTTNGNYSDGAVNMTGTVRIYVDTPDITKCRVRARVVG